ncbi:MAG: hypothetical protein J7L47_05690 [Candidatus Odinarchaeota archaeon]|nr:hypothetical protein [Candidatus Odinarchaeota archaeon]
MEVKLKVIARVFLLVTFIVTLSFASLSNSVSAQQISGVYNNNQLLNGLNVYESYRRTIADIKALESQGVILREGNHYIINFSRGNPRINGLLIKPFLNGTEIVRLYLDGKPVMREGLSYDYVSLNPWRRSIIIGSDEKPTSASISFARDNNFLQLDEDQRLILSAGLNVDLELKNRVHQGLIPLLVIKKTAKYWYVEVTNGPYQIYGFHGLLGDGLYYSRSGLSGNPVPMIIKIESQSNKTMIAAQGSNKSFIGDLIITGLGDLVVLTGNDTSPKIKFLTTSSCKFTSNANLSLIHVDNRDYSKLVVEEYPHIKFIGNLSKFSARALYAVLNSLTPDLRDAIRGVIIYSDEEFEKSAPKYSSAWTSVDRIIRLRKSKIECSILAHEAAHALTFKLGRTFLKEWQSKAGDVYGKNISHNYQTWTDNTTGPRNGCIRPYSCSNIFEDIATLTEAVYSNPSRVLEAINTGDERFLNKLNLLQKYKFIPPTTFHMLSKSIQNTSTNNVTRKVFRG